MKLLERIIPWLLLALVIGGEAAVAQFSGYPPLGYVQIANDSASAPTWQPNPGLLIVNNLSDLSSASAARTNLGLGSMAQQSAGSVGISGGSITGMPTPTNPTDVANKTYVDAAIAAAVSGIPQVSSLTPNSGSAGGGTAVAVSGFNFVGSTIVQFGTASAAAFNVNSAVSITATSPAGSGTVDLRVTNPSGISAIVNADQFTYAALPPAPAVTSISPSNGTAAGGTSVGVVGTNFTGATAVNFGATAASSFTVNSVSSITAVAPAGTGTVDVTVTTPSGTSPTSAADHFTYNSNCDTSTGGAISVSGGKRIHVFASGGTFTASGSCTVTYAIIGGGCAGGNTANSAGQGAGGGGGAGNVLTGTFGAVAGSYPIIVGGACAGSSVGGVVNANPGTVGQNAYSPAGGGNGGNSGAGYGGGSGNGTGGGAGGGAGAGGAGQSVATNVGGTGGAGAAISVPGLSGTFGGGGGGGGTTGGASSSGLGGHGGSQGQNGNSGGTYGAGGGGAGRLSAPGNLSGGAGVGGIVVLSYPYP